nr:MAG TPA: hypothetical protein [Caudoviricetes sp.]
MDSLLEKMLVMEITKNYCEDKETIQDVIKNLKKYTNGMDKSEDYETCIGKVIGRISTLSNLLVMKKLKDNREDMLTLITVLENEIENLKVIAKEVEVDVVTSK